MWILQPNHNNRKRFEPSGCVQLNCLKKGTLLTKPPTTLLLIRVDLPWYAYWWQKGSCLEGAESVRSWDSPVSQGWLGANWVQAKSRSVSPALATIHACMYHVHTDTLIHERVCTRFIHIYIYIYSCTCTYMYKNIHEFMRLYIHVCTCFYLLIVESIN